MNSDRDTPDQVRGGLPHSEIPGSPIARISPGLFAACHVLHRLSVPRHPPDALLRACSPVSPTEETAPPPRTGPSPMPCPRATRSGRRSRMKTLLEQTPSQGRGPVRLGHIINALFTLQSTLARHSPAPRSRTSPNPAPDPPDRRWCRLAQHSRPSRGGGGERTRTDDLLLAKQALSQLSYTPPFQKTVIRDQ